MKFKDVAHLYLGVEVIHPGLKNPRTLTGRWLDSLVKKGISVKPLLLPLSKMTEDDSNRMGVLMTLTQTAEEMASLLSKGYDLFGLIASGEALDKTTQSKLKKELV